MNGPKRPLLRGLPPHAVITKTVTMEDLRSESFAAVNPLRKVPAAIDAKRGDALFIITTRKHQI